MFSIVKCDGGCFLETENEFVKMGHDETTMKRREQIQFAILYKTFKRTCSKRTTVLYIGELPTSSQKSKCSSRQSQWVARWQQFVPRQAVPVEVNKQTRHKTPQPENRNISLARTFSPPRIISLTRKKKSPSKKSKTFCSKRRLSTMKSCHRRQMEVLQYQNLLILQGLGRIP